MFFTDEERRIFPYHDGEKERWADPLAIRRALLEAARGDMVGMIEEASLPPLAEGEGDHPPAALLGVEAGKARLVAAVREAFALAAFDSGTGKGCTEAMCWAVFDRWLEWQEKKGQRGGSQPGSPPSTACPPAGPSATAATSPSS